MTKYLLASSPFMGDSEPPFAIVTTSADDTPTSIEAHPDTDESGQAAAKELIKNFNRDPGSYPLNRLAVSYGSLQKVT